MQGGARRRGTVAEPRAPPGGCRSCAAGRVQTGTGVGWSAASGGLQRPDELVEAVERLAGAALHAGRELGVAGLDRRVVRVEHEPGAAVRPLEARDLEMDVA